MAQRLRSGNRLPAWLILVFGGMLVGVLALPFGERASALVPTVEADIESRLEELRDAIHSYAQDHPAWPGALGEWQFREQLLRTTDADGRMGSGDEFVHGPYLADEVPLNPANGRRTVVIVQRMPESALDQGGWIYSSETGVIRPDLSGTGTDGRRFFDL